MKFSKILLVSLLVAMSILLLQCEKKPVDQIEISKTLLKKMQTENSLKYAPEKYEMAMNYYNRAEQLLASKDYKKASVELEYFINVANAALSKTQNEKENEKYNQKETEIVYTDSEDVKSPVESPINNPEIPSNEVLGGLKHVVQHGECLTQIAQKYFKSSKYWKNIFEENKGLISNANIIYPGQELTIPTIQTKTQLGENEYKVQEGENLWKIAEKFFPNTESNHWQVIYSLNKDKIYNPNILRTGLVITIPNMADYEYAEGDSTYLVRKGDSFWSIANKINSLDSTKKISWRDIYYLNMTELSDSNSIYPDQIIRIP